MFNLIADCLQYSKESEGAFDIHSRPVDEVWDSIKAPVHLPHRAEVRTALAHIGYQKTSN